MAGWHRLSIDFAKDACGVIHSFLVSLHFYSKSQHRMDRPSFVSRTSEQALSWLYDRIDYERVRPGAQSNPFRLERIEHLLTLIGSPHCRIPAIHIAGTKGKGSTAAMVESVLRHSGIRTGLFTSPHIHSFAERLRVNGCIPSSDLLTDLVNRLIQVLEEAPGNQTERRPTFFEAATMLAWMFFDQENVELAVLETGLGGRLDCTNVCRPLLTMITSIGLDHTQILGDTIELIAAEKAGILKAGVPVIQGQLPVDASVVVADRASALQCPRFAAGSDFTSQFTSRKSHRRLTELQSCFSVSTPLHGYPGLSIPLIGAHQIHNATLAVMAADWLSDHGFPSITEETIRAGLKATRWPLRFEVFPGKPVVVLDAAHNPDSAAAVVSTLQDEVWQRCRRKVLLFASSADKDSSAMLRLLIPCFDHVVLTRYISNPRSIPPEQLLAQATSIEGYSADRFSLAETPETGLLKTRQLAQSDDMICVTGSIFLAAEVRTLLTADISPFPELP